MRLSRHSSVTSRSSISSARTASTADWDIQAEDSARQTITTFQQFIEQHRDEIAALQIFYSRPRAARLRYEDVKQLNKAIARPPLALTTDKLWQAYEMLDRPRVKGGKSTKRMLTDIVSLIRYTIERDHNEQAMLEPYSEVVAQRFAIWLKEQERLRGQPFTAEQLQWLTMIRDTIASSVTIGPTILTKPIHPAWWPRQSPSTIRARTAHNPTRLEREVSCMSEKRNCQRDG